MIDLLVSWSGWLVALIATIVAFRGNVHFDLNEWLRDRRKLKAEREKIKRRKRPVARRFEQLSERQKDFLAREFRKGSRYFEVYSDTTRERWFEELLEWRYLERTPQYAYVIGDGPLVDDINFTMVGWRELERVQS